MITELYIDGQKLDQYKDENVKVVSSVASIKDLSKNTSDFSNSFTIPASGINNKILKHYYDFNIDNTFDARKTTNGEIFIGGALFKTGKWQLQKVNVKQGDPESYTINFSGKLSSIKDLASSLELKDLDLSAFDHDYNSDNVISGLTTKTFLEGDIIYNLFAKKRYFYNSNVADNTNTDKIANIAAISGAEAGVIWNDLKASIKVIRILEAIETKLGITFSRDFFASSEFSELYLWLNPTKNKDIEGNGDIINWDSQDPTAVWMNLATNIASYPTNADTGQVTNLVMVLTPEPAYNDVEYTLKMFVNDEVYYESQNITGEFITPSVWGFSDWLLVSESGSQDKEVYWTISSSQEFKYKADLDQNIGGGYGNRTFTPATATTVESIFSISDNIPKMKIIDFLKGIFNAYKLIVIPTSENEYYVNTIDGYYNTGNTIDITRHIDWKSFDVERGDILNEIAFKFQEPTTILNKQFETTNGRGYGDEDLRLYTDETQTELLDGGKLEVKLPFEQIVYEKLIDQNDGSALEIQYGAIIDESLEPANPKAHLFYTQLAPIGGSKIAFINDLGNKVTLTTNLNTPLHTDSFANSSYSTTFAADFSSWSNLAISNNLYTNHYKGYVESIFNIKKRTVKHSAKNLPLHILTKLELNDTLLIKGNYFRIDKYTYNLLTGETDFELVNLVSQDGLINKRIAGTNNIFANSQAVKKYVQLINEAESLPTKVDLGDGTDWVTLDLSDTVNNLLEIAFDTNETSLDRTMQIDASSGGQTILINLYQYKRFITSDSSKITSDNNIITSDNNG